jgi:hypothetical protein
MRFFDGRRVEVMTTRRFLRRARRDKACRVPCVVPVVFARRYDKTTAVWADTARRVPVGRQHKTPLHQTPLLTFSTSLFFTTFHAITLFFMVWDVK